MNEYNNMQMPEKKDHKTAIIIILIILVLGLAGYIVYDKFIKIEPNNNEQTVEDNPVNKEEQTVTGNVLSESEALAIAEPLFNKMIKIKDSFENAESADCEELTIGNIIPLCLYQGLTEDNNLLNDFNSIYSSSISFDSIFTSIDESTKILDKEGLLLDKYNYGALLYTVKDGNYYTIGECNQSGTRISENQTLKVNKIEENRLSFTYEANASGEKFNNNFILVKEKGNWKIGSGTDIPDGCY